MALRVHATALPGLMVVEPRRFDDARGWFMESHNQRTFDAALVAAGEPPAGAFAQDNLSRSGRHVLRGLHYQLPPHAQGKLVTVMHGRIWDVAVDIRRGSATRGRWFGLELDAQVPRQLWIPAGFAHGFVVLSDEAVVSYKATDFYAVGSERAIAWNDPELGIAWPLPAGVQPVMADKDRHASAFGAAELPP